MSRMRTHLWFDADAEAAMNFYLSVFPKSRKVRSTTLGGSEPGGDGLSVHEFELDDMSFIAIDAGPTDAFNERVCLYVETEDQAETDYYWKALTADGGVEKPCGWLTDKYGIYWQVTPKILPQLLADPDRAKADRVLQAFYKMKRVVIADLEAAARTHAA